MKTLESYMVNAQTQINLPIDVTPKGVCYAQLKGRFWYLVWIKNEFESGPCEIIISHN